MATLTSLELNRLAEELRDVVDVDEWIAGRRDKYDADAKLRAYEKAANPLGKRREKNMSPRLKKKLKKKLDEDRDEHKIEQLLKEYNIAASNAAAEERIGREVKQLRAAASEHDLSPITDDADDEERKQEELADARNADWINRMREFYRLQELHWKDPKNNPAPTNTEAHFQSTESPTIERIDVTTQQMHAALEDLSESVQRLSATPSDDDIALEDLSESVQRLGSAPPDDIIEWEHPLASDASPDLMADLTPATILTEGPNIDDPPRERDNLASRVTRIDRNVAQIKGMLEDGTDGTTSAQQPAHTPSPTMRGLTAAMATLTLRAAAVGTALYLAYKTGNLIGTMLDRALNLSGLLSRGLSAFHDPEKDRITHENIAATGEVDPELNRALLETNTGWMRAKDADGKERYVNALTGESMTAAEMAAPESGHADTLKKLRETTKKYEATKQYREEIRKDPTGGLLPSAENIPHTGTAAALAINQQSAELSQPEPAKESTPAPTIIAPQVQQTVVQDVPSPTVLLSPRNHETALTTFNATRFDHPVVHPGVYGM